MNRVKYGLSNVHYAKATIASDGTATYETPVPIPGAVNLGMDPQGSNEPFYADNIAYYVVSSNTGYEGDLEIALVPDSFRKDILGEMEDENGVLIERTDSVAQPFALLFQFEGDEKATRHVFYNCTATRPAVAGATKEDGTDVQTESLTITATSIYNAKVAGNIVKGKCLNDGKSATQYAAWNTKVYQPEDNA